MKTNAIISTFLAVGLIFLITCQAILFSALPRQGTTAAAVDIPAESIDPADSGFTLASSVIQFVSCSADDLADAVALVKPAVVNIDVASSDAGPAGQKGRSALDFDMPSSQALQANEETLGSGIIVNGRGYILTCYHLIQDYPKVYVTVFSSIRRTYNADVVDVDIANDLALLRICPDSPIPVARMGNSDMVKITDSVLTMGSPFGFEHTVTEGIISDNKRSIAIRGRTYRDFFQTDAPINRGSAGGALVNTEGEVIGVLTAIASRSGYFCGVGFAIPINRARALLLKSIDDGEGR